MIVNSVFFLVWSFVFWLGTAATAKVIHFAIQPGQIFGRWQHKLRTWDLQGTAWGTLLFKIGGGCAMCFSHAISLLSFPLYCIFLVKAVGLWVPSWSGILIVDIVLNIVWFFLYVYISTVLALYFIAKLFEGPIIVNNVIDQGQGGNRQ